MNQVVIFFRYLFFLFSSRNEHSIHSPFIFSFYTEVIRSGKQFYIFREIEKQRAKLRNNKKRIRITDLGAGSKANRAQERRIKDIARSAGKSPSLCRILFRTVLFQQPSTILELGTSFGISSLYLASANQQAKLITFEGCHDTAETALQTFQQFPAVNIELVEGNLDQTLEEKVNTLSSIDMVYIDANHRYEPTMRYFEICLKKSHEGTVFVLDDIYWSAEMMQAWKDIKNHASVTLSIDLFHIGIVFLRKGQPTQHFKLRT